MRGLRHDLLCIALIVPIRTCSFRRIFPCLNKFPTFLRKLCILQCALSASCFGCVCSWLVWSGFLSDGASLVEGCGVVASCGAAGFDGLICLQIQFHII